MQHRNVTVILQQDQYDELLPAIKRGEVLILSGPVSFSYGRTIRMNAQVGTMEIVQKGTGNADNTPKL